VIDTDVTRNQNSCTTLTTYSIKLTRHYDSCDEVTIDEIQLSSKQQMNQKCRSKKKICKTMDPETIITSGLISYMYLFRTIQMLVPAVDRCK
jgi:hypothetical protein